MPRLLRSILLAPLAIAAPALAQTPDLSTAPVMASSPAATAPVAAKPPEFPVYLSLAPDIHDFRAFADGGWDGAWYVGFNTCWIVKLPAAPAGNWTRAFIGARLGRAKTVPRPGGQPWDKDPIPGKVSIAIAGEPAFPPSQSFVLADNGDIPYDPDPSNPNLNAGQGEWFWTEIPVSLVDFSGPNYLALWSPTEDLVSASSAPILGAAIDTSPSAQPRAWLDSSVEGVPPRDPSASIGVPVSFYLPSLALKLVPANDKTVSIGGFSAVSSPGGYGVRFSAQGDDVSQAWVEGSSDGQGWERVSPVLLTPPYSFFVPNTRLGNSYAAAGTVYLRAVAQDNWNNLGMSAPAQLQYRGN